MLGNHKGMSDDDAENVDAKQRRKGTVTVRCTDKDKELFHRAMQIDGIDQLSTWIIRAARVHANEVVNGGGMKAARILADLSRQVDAMAVDLGKLVDQNSDLED